MTGQVPGSKRVSIGVVIIVIGVLLFNNMLVVILLEELFMVIGYLKDLPKRLLNSTCKEAFFSLRSKTFLELTIGENATGL